MIPREVHSKEVRTDVRGHAHFWRPFRVPEIIQISARVPPRFLVDEERLIFILIIFLVHSISNLIVSDLFRFHPIW